MTTKTEAAAPGRKLLSRAQLQKTVPLPFEDVEVPELGGLVRVQSMTALQREEFIVNLRRPHCAGGTGPLSPGDFVQDVGDHGSLGTIVRIDPPPHSEWSKCLVLWSKQARVSRMDSVPRRRRCTGPAPRA